MTAYPTPAARLADVRPYESRAGIGWKCRTCGDTWSGSREHACKTASR